MTGVLLVNMGGPQSKKEMLYFLRKMFRDPCILPFKKIGREILSIIISYSQYKNSWKKYELIGGSPMVKSTHIILEKLSDKLGGNYLTGAAYSYSKPLIKNGINSLLSACADKIIVVPMYPHDAISTTGSIKNDIYKIAGKSVTNITIIDPYYNNSLFISFWSNLVKDHIEKYKLSAPILLFSAHSIPEYHVLKRDNYLEHVAESAQLIASDLKLEYKLAYQSQMKRGKWIGPATENVLKELSEKDKEIILIPISFVNENMETLYDIDIKMIPECKKTMSFKSLSRVKIPACSDVFLELLVGLVIKN